MKAFSESFLSAGGLAAVALSLALSGCAAGPESYESRLLQLAQDVEQQGDHATAAAMYERALEQGDQPADIQVRLGNALLASDQPQAAADAFRGALAENIELAPALLGLGTAQLRLEQPQSALRNLARAAPEINSVAAWSRLGAAQTLVGQPDQAVGSFARAVALDPRNLDVQANLALAESLGGHHASALESLRSVVDSPLAETRHFRNLILVMVLAGRGDEARQVELPDLSTADRQSLIVSAERIRALPDAASRAQALGLASARD